MRRRHQHYHPPTTDATPGLFDPPPIPAAPTETQRVWARRVGSTGMPARILAGFAALTLATPKEIHRWVGVHTNITTLRAYVTKLHQSHRLVRTGVIRDGQHCYCLPERWEDRWGSVPSRAHRGRGMDP